MVATKRNGSVAERILKTFQERGYRSTSPRRAMAAVIGAEQNHFTAEDLRRKLPSSIGRATVYRTLKILVDWDILCRVHLSDGDLRYQLSHVGHHHHLICADCDSARDLIGCDIEEALAAASARHGFEITGHWLEVYGHCGECGSDERDPSRPDLVSTADSGDALSQ